MKSIKVLNYPLMREEKSIKINHLSIVKFIFDDNGNENIQIRFCEVENTLYIVGSSPIKIRLEKGCNSFNIELVDFE
jgi:hypothetical protein